MGKPRVSMCQDGASLGGFDTVEPVTIRYGKLIGVLASLAMHVRSNSYAPSRSKSEGR